MSLRRKGIVSNFDDKSWKNNEMVSYYIFSPLGDVVLAIRSNWKPMKFKKNHL